MIDRDPPKVTAGLCFSMKDAGTTKDGHPVLKLEGALDADAAPILMEELERRVAMSDKILHLDFRTVSFISSSGIGSLVAGIGEFRDEEGDIILHGLTPELLHVFEMLGLMDYVSYHA